MKTAGQRQSTNVVKANPMTAAVKASMADVDNTKGMFGVSPNARGLERKPVPKLPDPKPVRGKLAKDAGLEGMDGAAERDYEKTQWDTRSRRPDGRRSVIIPKTQKSTRTEKSGRNPIADALGK